MEREVKKIGVLGASFNPPTRGHEDIVNQALAEFDEILLVPSIAHPFGKKTIALNDRLAMLKLFIAPWQANEKNGVKIFNIEPVIQKKNPQQNKIYTYDVLSAIESYYHSQHEAVRLQFIVGPDNADPTVWQKFYRYEEIEKRWGIWVAKEKLPIHSTMVRDFIAKSNVAQEKLKTDLRQWVSEPIADYIIEHHLYHRSRKNSIKISPTVTITLVIFSIVQGELAVLIEEKSLPVTMIDPEIDSSLEQAAQRLFKEYMAVETPYLEQVQTIGFDNRIPEEWSVTINYYSLISNVNRNTSWVKLSDLATHELVFDHRAIIMTCLQRFQNKSLYTSLPIFLLPAEFTLTELQRTYETVLGFKMEKKSFRRRLLDAGFLEETGNIRRASHRPAQLYRLAHPQPYFFARIIEGVREGRL